MTTKYPVCALLMELACFHDKEVHEGGRRLDTRAGNREADSLANGHVEDFSPERVPFVGTFSLRALQMAREAETEYQELKQRGGVLPRRDRRLRKRKPEEKMQVTDPW